MPDLWHRRGPCGCCRKGGTPAHQRPLPPTATTAAAATAAGATGAVARVALTTPTRGVFFFCSFSFSPCRCLRLTVSFGPTAGLRMEIVDEGEDHPVRMLSYCPTHCPPQPDLAGAPPPPPVALSLPLVLVMRLLLRGMLGGVPRGGGGGGMHPTGCGDRKSTRLNSSHITRSRMPSSA